MNKLLSAVSAIALLAAPAFAHEEAKPAAPAPEKKAAMDCAAMKDGSKERTDCEAQKAAEMKTEKKEEKKH